MALINKLDRNSVKDDTGSIASQVTASVTPTAGRVYVIDVIHYGSTGSGDASVPDSVTGFGLGNWTLIKSFVDTSISAGCISRWAAYSATTPTPGAVTINFHSGRPVFGNSWSLYELIGTVVTSGVISTFVQSVSNEDVVGTNATLNVTLATFANIANGAISAFMTQVAGASVPGVTTSRWAQIDSTGIAIITGGASQALQTQSIAVNDTTASITWNAAGYLYGIASEIALIPSTSPFPVEDSFDWLGESDAQEVARDASDFLLLVSADSRPSENAPVVPPPIQEALWVWDDDAEEVESLASSDSIIVGANAASAPRQEFGESIEFFDPDGTVTQTDLGYMQSNAVLSPAQAEDAWDWDSECYADGSDADLTVVLTADAAPVFSVDVVYYDDCGLIDEGQDYEDPWVLSTEWSGPIQPNAPPGVDFLPEDHFAYFEDQPVTTLFELGFFNSTGPTPPSPALPDSDFFIEEELVDSELVGLDDKPVGADALAPSPLSQFDDGVATIDDEVEDFFADHFGNDEAETNVIQEDYDWEGDQENVDRWELYIEQPIGANALLALILTVEDAWDFSVPDEDDNYLAGVDDSPVVANAILVPIVYSDDVSTNDDEVEEFFADHFGNDEQEAIPNNESWPEEVELEDDIFQITNDYPLVANAVLALTPPPFDAWDWDAEDSEDDAALYQMIVNANDAQEVSAPVPTEIECGWDWDAENGEDSDAIVSLIANANDGQQTDAPPPALTPVPDDAWDFWSEDTADDLLTDESLQSVAVIAVTDGPYDEVPEFADEVDDYEQFLENYVEPSGKQQSFNEDWYEWEPNYDETEWLTDTETAPDVPPSQLIDERWEWDQLEPQEESWEWEGQQTSSNHKHGRRGFIMLHVLGAVEV